MSIQINKNACVGCNKCKEVCPGNLIHMDENNKAYIKYPKDCWGCTSCIKECKHKAVGFYLGADMGGHGSLVYTKESEEVLEWVVEKTDGTSERILINKKDSNQY